MAGLVALVVVAGGNFLLVGGEDDDSDGTNAGSTGGSAEGESAEVDGPGTIGGGTPEPHGAALLYAEAVAGGGCESAVELWSESFRGDDTFDEAVSHCEEIDAGLPEFSEVLGLGGVTDVAEGEAVVALNLGGTDAPAEVRVVEQADGWWFDGPVHDGAAHQPGETDRLDSQD